MATKPETRLALEAIGMRFMPAREGVAHLIAELEAGAPEPEVLVTDRRYQRAFGLGDADRAGADPAAIGRPARLLGGGPVATDGRLVLTGTLDPAADPFLAQHRLDDRPLLPLVVGLEFLCEAAERAAGRPEVAGGIRDVRAVSGLSFHSDRPRDVRVRARRLDAVSVECELVSDVCTRDGRIVERDRVHLTGVVELGRATADPVPARPALPPGPWRQVAYAERGSKFFAGPPLRCLRKIRVEGQTAWGRIAAPAAGELAGPGRPQGCWAVPAAVLDACLYAAGLLAWERVEPGTALPVGIRRLRLGRPPEPGEPCLVEARFRGREGRRGSFDVSLWGDNGDLILQAHDYQISWLAN
jgi:hypothetical protein